MIKHVALFGAVAGLNAGVAVLSQEVDPAPGPAPTAYSALSALEYPVVAGDIADRPYRIVGEVTAEVRKATLFSRSPSERHVHRELWERAERLGADAVIHARFGDARVTALSWGSRRATGQAIKFVAGDGTAPATEPAQ